MKYRLRFVVIHTLIVFVILALCITGIYFAYSGSRLDDFDKRLYAQASGSYISFYHITKIDTPLANKIQYYAAADLANTTSIIINDSGKIVSSNPVSLQYNADTLLLKKIKTAGKYSFNKDNNEYVGIYFKNFTPPGYIIMSASDKYGETRIGKLRLIMILATSAAVLIIGLFSFFYVIKITNPLVKLGNQMKQIREGNLSERFDFGKGNIKHNELLQIADNFNSMLDRLEKSFELQKSFVHHASHELRTPLAIMLSQTESALRKNLSAEEAREVLQSLKDDQQEMIELTNSLLLLSQYERADNSANLPLVRLDEILYDTIEAIKRIFRDMNISVEFTHVPDNELNLSIKGNEILLRSAFRNLIKNAYQYSDDKNVSVIIDEDNSHINLLFKNKGKLLSTEDQSNLFVPFFRGANAQQQKGFGLGLSIVKRIILLHKGDISYNIADGRENCFKISFEKTTA